MPGPLATRFMAEFRCTGPDCEANCCANWSIEVDLGHVVKIARLLERTDEGRAELQRAFEFPEEKDRTQRKYAKMKLTEDGVCPFLDGERLCSLQRRWGARILPNVCAHYPRSINWIHDHMELSGQLSCPEVARRCLTIDGAAELVPIEGTALSRGWVRQELVESEDPYPAWFLRVRELLMALTASRRWPVASRLFHAVCFAERVSEFYHLNSPSFDAERMTFEMACVRDQTILDEMHAQLGALEVPDGMALLIVANVLAHEAQHRAAGAFRGVIDAVLDSYVRPAGDAITAEELWRAYRARREAVLARDGARIELYFENYCQQFWLRDWFLDVDNLYVHVQALLVRVAVLRFLLISHPALQKGPSEPEERRAYVDNVAVQVVYSFARGIEHQDEFLTLITKGLRAQLPTLAHAAALLHV
jgi:lysine-N-methylase